MIKRVVAGSSGLSILGTVIYFLINHISEVQYNNWGNGVWNSLLTIQGTGDCDKTGTKNNEDHKACIKKDITDAYDLENMWNSDYWKQRYQTQISNTSNDQKNISQKFQKLGSWEKLRELCTKGIDEMIRKNEWEKLSNALGINSSQSTQIPNGENIDYEECWKTKSVTVSKK